MAIQINAGDTKRGDIFLLDPFEIEVREDLRGRHIPPPMEKIVEMAESLLEHGQRQAVECRRKENKRLLLTLGFTRMAAVRLIRDGFTDSQGYDRCDPEFRIKVVLNDSNDETAFVNNVVENAHRNETSAIDDAYNQHRLRDRYGKSDTEIARLYKYKTPGKVGQLRKLLSLSSEIQKRIHDGTLTVSAALEMSALPEPEQDALLASEVPVSASVIKQAVREKAFEASRPADVVPDTETGQMTHRILNDDAHTPATDSPARPAVVKPSAISMREVREFVVELREHEEKRIRSIGDAMNGWLAGKEPKETVLEVLRDLL